MITAVSILTLKVLIMRALVKECSVFRINRCSATLLPQKVLKIVYIRVYINICVDIIKWLFKNYLAAHLIRIFTICISSVVKRSSGLIFH